MAAIYGARAIADKDGKPSGRYHYCRWSDEESFCYPIGYCAQECAGHETQEGARAHQRQYELDHEVSRHEEEGCQRQCAVCQNWTTHRVIVGRTFPKVLVLCAEHDDPEFIEQLFVASETVE